MLARLEELRLRLLAAFGLKPDDPRRFIVAQVILYVGTITIVGIMMYRKVTAEPEVPTRRTIPAGVEPA